MNSADAVKYLEDLNLITLAIPAFVILILLEIFLTIKMKMDDSYALKDSAASISMGLGNVLMGVFSKALALLVFSLAYEFRVWTIPANAVWAWVLLFFAEDACYYLMHRTSHGSRFFWASHVVHHSSQHYNLSTALRQTWTGNWMTFLFWLALPLIGFHPLMIMTQMSISLLYQFWIHTEVVKKMPRWYEYIFNTPSHHRVHHATNPRYLDRNHAGILIIWDRMFGTFEEEDPNDPPVYGLTENIETYNPIGIAFSEWRPLLKTVFGAGLSLQDRLRYFYMPPGWRHDGTGKLSSDLRREWEERRE